VNSEAAARPDEGLLVTGAGGQLGQALRVLRPEATYLERADLDVTDEDAVHAALEQHRPEVIVHAAAWTKVDEAEAQPAQARMVNVGGTRAVVNAAQEIGAVLVYPSTDYVFSGQAKRPYTEEAATEPLSMYAKTKLEAETVVREYPRHLIVRTSWVFGEGRNFVRTILELASSRDELAVVADQIGLPTYALDLAAGILELLDLGATGTFHLAGQGDPCSWAELADSALSSAVVAAVLPRKPAVRAIRTEDHQDGRPGPFAVRPPYSVLDCSKAASLGVVLRRWREALPEYVRSLKASPPEAAPTSQATGAT
jgi:dTDP-4-dehydrorhamnose reductase